MLAGAAECGLNFITNKQAAVMVRHLRCNFEVVRRRCYKAAHALDGLGHERSNAPAGGGLDHIFNVLRAGCAACVRMQLQRAAITVGVERVCDARHLRAAHAPSRLRR